MNFKSVSGALLQNVKFVKGNGKKVHDQRLELEGNFLGGDKAVLLQ